MSTDSGLVFTDNISDSLNPYEIIGIDQAQKFNAKAVYFRRILRNKEAQDNYISIPQVYIYDEDFDDASLVDIHRNLWSSGVVPFFYIITSTQVKIFSCTQKAEQSAKGLKVSPIKEFEIASSIIAEYNEKKFSAKLFASGAFWQREDSTELLNPKNGPYETLLDGLLAAKKNLSSQAKEQKIHEQTISKLLIMCLLVKYLEEKKEGDVKLFAVARDFLNRFRSSDVPVEKFTDVLRQGQAIEFFENLSEKFSGKVFQLFENEKLELRDADLNFVADVFDAKITGSGQYVIWELYSFNYLPIELISGIYEAFLNHSPQPKENKGIVYTPPYLVNFLIDECMPLNKAKEYFENENFKVLDPACGSGIFLVSAFKRMIQWKAIINFEKTGSVHYPDLETVKRIIRNNIFGVDIEYEATRLTIFSLCIAICEKLSPMQIWQDLQFDDLNENNIRANNFFAYFNDIDGLERQSFDLVIGNPPFNPPLGMNNSNYYKKLISDYPVQPSAPIQDNNLAIHFLDRCMRFPKYGKSTCLIVPSSAWLYNSNSHSYRKHFIETHTVSKIIDFTHLSDVLFYGRANVAVCAVVAQNASPVEKASILHTVIHRAKVAEKRYFFEIDHYDYNFIRYQTAIKSPFVWKANLLGGGRLLRLIERLGNIETVENFLIEKKEEHGWKFAEGYIVQHDGSLDEQELISKGYTKADWITGLPSVVTKSFDEYGTVDSHIEDNIYFYRAASENKEIFSPPHVLIKENLGKNNIPILISDEYISFKDQIIGIHAPSEQREDLFIFYEKFKRYNDIYRFILTSTSSKAGISLSPSVLVKNDIMNLPFPFEDEDIELSLSEEIVKNDVSTHLIKLGHSAAPLYKPADDVNLKEFGKVFCQAMNSIYENDGQSWQVDSFVKNEEYVGFAFCYGPKKSESVISWRKDDASGIQNLVTNKTQRNARVTRVLREYIHVLSYDILILIKPNILRYWLKSVALRDTDETFADLKRAGF